LALWDEKRKRLVRFADVEPVRRRAAFAPLDV
jgi:hypothetical protein